MMLRAVVFERLHFARALHTFYDSRNKAQKYTFFLTDSVSYGVCVVKKRVGPPMRRSRATSAEASMLSEFLFSSREANEKYRK